MDLNKITSENIGKECILSEKQLKELKILKGGLDLNLLSKDTAVAYVDGSANQDGKIYSCGAVIFFIHKNSTQKHVIRYAYSVNTQQISEEENLRHISGELLSAEIVMDFCINKNIKKVVIYHDFKELGEFYRGGSKPQTKTTKKYVELCKLISQILDVKFVYVEAHSGNYFNDMADQLAKYAIRHPNEIKQIPHDNIQKYVNIINQRTNVKANHASKNILSVVSGDDMKNTDSKIIISKDITQSNMTEDKSKIEKHLPTTIETNNVERQSVDLSVELSAIKEDLKWLNTMKNLYNSKSESGGCNIFEDYIKMREREYADGLKDNCARILRKYILMEGQIDYEAFHSELQECVGNEAAGYIVMAIAMNLKYLDHS